MSHLASPGLFVFLLALVGCGDSARPIIIAGGDSSSGGTPGGSSGGAPGQGGSTSSSTGASSPTGGSVTGTGGSLAADCGTTTGRGNIVGQGGIVRVTQNGLEYVVQNNIWAGTGVTLKMWAEGTSYLVTDQTGNNSGAAAPVAYPSIFIGSNYTHTSANSGLPKQVNSLGPIATRMTHNADASIPGIFNASYDVWFSSTAAGDPEAPSAGYLMVWLWDPPEKQPAGSRQASGVTINGVSGTWDVWHGGNNVTSYVRTQTIKSLTFDLNLFIRDAINRGYKSSTAYLSNVFGGFEIWSGGVGLDLQCFYVHIGESP
jgi:hypothetical protein